jgi:hypothetical protein
MVEPAIVDVIQDYLAAVRRSGIQVSQAILFGSHARAARRSRRVTWTSW